MAGRGTRGQDHAGETRRFSWIYKKSSVDGTNTGNKQEQLCGRTLSNGRGGGGDEGEKSRYKDLHVQ